MLQSIQPAAEELSRLMSRRGERKSLIAAAGGKKRMPITVMAE
jgi:hypothetical protein